MKTTAARVTLVFIDALLLIALVGLAPFAWILRDGLGPDAVASDGIKALVRASMAFYTGPAILLLGGLRCLVHHITRKEGNRVVGRGSPFRTVGVVLLVGALSALFIGLIYG